MSYFEYNVSGELTPELEEKTKLLVTKLNDGTAFYNIQRYWDEEVTPEKKRRFFVITAPVNIWIPLYNLLNLTDLSFSAYHKQRFI